jgi:hypothetical protein
LNHKKATSPFFKDKASIDNRINLVKYSSDAAKFKELVIRAERLYLKLNKQRL